MEIKLHRLFLKKYKKLPKSVKLKFVERKNLFIKERFHPLLNNHSVDSRYSNCRSINVTGDYRAIFKQENNQAIFLLIGTHSQLYG